MKTRIPGIFSILVTMALFTGIVLAATTPSQTPVSAAKKKRRKHSSAKTPHYGKPLAATLVSQPSKYFVPVVATSSKTFRPSVRRHTAGRGLWDEPTFADSTLGDNVDGEDLDVRRAAVEALGPLNGSVVVSDPNTGRVLAMVNQKLALRDGYQPCSTIKVPVAFAALSEGIIERDTLRKIYGRTKMNTTQALAKQNNQFFAGLGEELGSQKVIYDAPLFGLGEKAGLDIPGEHAGHFPAEPPKNGGMGMLTSFGEEISLTPLQLAAIMGSIANGGTLYYLQHPRTPEEVAGFVPRIKRRLDIETQITQVEPGMRGAVQYGTARRINAITEDPIKGKTGTCSDRRTHLGWFGSFDEVNGRKVVVAVLLTGGKPCIGPAAAGVAGEMVNKICEPKFFPAKHATTPAHFI